MSKNIVYCILPISITKKLFLSRTKCLSEDINQIIADKDLVLKAVFCLMDSMYLHARYAYHLRMILLDYILYDLDPAYGNIANIYQHDIGILAHIH